MAIIYFDAGALVKLVVEETGSDLAARLWDGCDTAVSARTSYAEVRGALRAARRHDHLDDDAMHQALRGFERLWASVRRVEITRQVETNAGRLAVDLDLSGVRALHLACALVVRDPALIVASWDGPLAEGAKQLGLAVSPPPSG